MKTIQKKREVTEYYNLYVANDGTEFRDEAECEKYEKSAKGVVSAKYVDLVVKQGCEEDVAGFGSGDDRVDVVSVRSEDDFNVVMQMLLLERPYYSDDGYKETLEHYKALVRRAIDDNDVLLINRWYGDEGFWIMGTSASLKEKIDAFCTPAKKDGDNA